MAPEASAIQPDLLLRLPRELRDEIYNYVLQYTRSILLTNPYKHNIPPLFWKDPTLQAEALEVFYRINSFIYDMGTNPSQAFAESWGSYPHVKQHIRHLTVACTEGFSATTDPLEYEKAKWSSLPRRRWAQFLDIPHLKTLVIDMQKTHDTALFTLDFGPILYHLRALRPHSSLVFNISFDTLLEASWNDPWWQQFNPNPMTVQVTGIGHEVPDSYQPMGFIDVSDLIEDPSDEDREYVAEYLEDEKMPPARNVGSGLLSETPASRRALGRHYVVKEPTLLRVLMRKHYDVYLQCIKERKATAHEAASSA